MRKTLMTAVLMLALSCPVTFAGEMGTPPVAPAPQPNSMQELDIDDSTVANDSLTQAVFDAILSVLL